MSIESLIFEKGAPGRRAATMAAMDVPTEPTEDLLSPNMLRKEAAPLPEVSEIEVVVTIRTSRSATLALIPASTHLAPAR